MARIVQVLVDLDNGYGFLSPIKSDGEIGEPIRIIEADADLLYALGVLEERPRDAWS